MRLNAQYLKNKALTSAALSALLTALVFWAWPKHETLVVMDMTRAIQSPSVQLSHSKLSKEAQLKIMARFSALLPEVIKAYGEKHQVTIVSALVLSRHGSRDITNAVITEVITRMKQDV